MHNVFNPIKNELTQVLERMDSFYKIKNGDLRQFSHLEEHIKRCICPALVLFVGMVYSKITEKVVSLAEVIQFVYLASAVHADVNENDTNKKNWNREKPDYKEGNQYPVLVGDYLYGRFFTTLCDAEIVEYLSPLSEVICLINEYGIVRCNNEHKSADVRDEDALMDMAVLLTVVCKLAGEMVGAGKDQQIYLSKMGLSLGMAIEKADVQQADQADTFFKAALAYSEQLIPGKGRDNLRCLLLYLMNKNSGDNRMVC